MWRDRTAVLSFLVMESLAWFLLATVLAGAAGGAGPAYPTVALALVGGFGLVRALQRFDLRPATLVVIGGIGSVLALLVLLNVQYNPGGSLISLGWALGFAGSPEGYLASRWPETWGAAVVVGTWFRGVHLAQRDVAYNLVFGSFSAGLGLLVLALLLGQASNAAAAINAAALPFFMAGLLALALTQLSRSGQPDAAAPHGPWLPILLGTVGGLALVSILIGVFPLDVVNRALAPVGLLVLRVLDLIILAIALPIGWVVTKIVAALLGRTGFEWPQFNRVATDSARQLQEQGDQNAVAAFFLLVFKFLFLAALVLAVAYVLYRIFRRLRRPAVNEDELRESVFGEGSLGADLAALMRGLLGRFNRGGGADREPALPAGILRLRRLYLRALDAAAAQGAVRPPAATPHEFAPTLVETFHSPAAAALSERFAAARYGLLEPSREELAALDRAVRDMKHESGPPP